MGSVYLCPKVITFFGFHCITKKLLGVSLVNVLHCKYDDVDDDVDHADDGRPLPQSEEVAAAVVRQHRLRLQRRSAVGRRHLEKIKSFPF